MQLLSELQKNYKNVKRKPTGWNEKLLRFKLSINCQGLENKITFEHKKIRKYRLEEIENRLDYDIKQRH
jgi:hypothetical protein